MMSISNTPFIQDVIKSVCDLDNLDRTLNYDQSVTIGCSYISWTKSTALKCSLKVYSHIHINFAACIR
jgi:hypothetical protein